jgi:hypothetical protein
MSHEIRMKFEAVCRCGARIRFAGPANIGMTIKDAFEKNHQGEGHGGLLRKPKKTVSKLP